MNALGAFVITAPTAFALGWFLRGITDRHIRGTIVNDVTKDKVGRFLDWLGHPRKLTVLVVITAIAVLGGIGYTFTSRQAAESDSERLQDCLTAYTVYASTSQASRTKASVAASTALRDFVNDMTPVNRARYLSLFAKYQQTAIDKPIRLFDRQFCGDYAAGRLP